MKNVLIMGLFCMALALFGCGGNDAAPSPVCSAAKETTGFTRVRVVDGMTDEPLCGARVVFPEAGVECRTDEAGLTPLVELPCVFDAAHDALYQVSEGRTTMIVYAEGYVPYLLLYMRVLPGAERETPTVYMFADDGSLKVFEVIEAPPMEWAERVVERYGE